MQSLNEMFKFGAFSSRQLCLISVVFFGRSLRFGRLICAPVGRADKYGWPCVWSALVLSVSSLLGNTVNTRTNTQRWQARGRRTTSKHTCPCFYWPFQTPCQPSGFKVICTWKKKKRFVPRHFSSWLMDWGIEDGANVWIATEVELEDSH